MFNQYALYGLRNEIHKELSNGLFFARESVCISDNFVNLRKTIISW